MRDAYKYHERKTSVQIIDEETDETKSKEFKFIYDGMTTKVVTFKLYKDGTKQISVHLNNDNVRLLKSSSK